jgi:SlyX protein
MSNELEDRITELEIKASFTEDLLDKLDLIITRQQDTIDSLLRQLQELRQRVDQPLPLERPNPQDELPPHY